MVVNHHVLCHDAWVKHRGTKPFPTPSGARDRRGPCPQGHGRRLVLDRVPRIPVPWWRRGGSYPPRCPEPGPLPWSLARCRTSKYQPLPGLSAGPHPRYVSAFRARVDLVSGLSGGAGITASSSPPTLRAVLLDTRTLPLAVWRYLRIRAAFRPPRPRPFTTGDGRPREGFIGRRLGRPSPRRRFLHGLVVGTRRIYRRYAAALLAECAGTPTPDWSRLTVPTIAAFVQTRASRLRPSACRAPVTATRAFLRFLATRGVVPAGIEGAVPTLREWKYASLPRALAAEDVQRVLAAVDETRPSEPRDRAILLLLTRLGLRAGEVAALTVNDIDWHDGSVRVAGKGGRERRLPLAADVGAALVAALRSRPRPARPR